MACSNQVVTILSPIVIKPSQKISKSEIIIIVALVILIFLVTVGGAYLWWTASRFGQRNKRTSVMIPTGSTGIASTPFTNQYIRTTSGYWTDNGNGVVTFSTYPQQSWSFNGQFLTNDLTFNALQNNNGQLSLSILPSGRNNRTTYSFIFTGQSLITANSASSSITLVVTDTNNNPAFGQLSLYQSQNGANPTLNQILNLSTK